MKEENNKIMKNIANMLVEELNSNYRTVGEIAKELGYSDHSYLSRKAKKLKIGYKAKTLVLLSKEDQEILKKSIKRRGAKFSSE